MIQYRVVTEMDELEILCDLEHRIWQAAAREMSPIVVRVTALRGGLALAAYDGAEMVGMLWSFPVKRRDKFVLWSFVTGVLPQYRSAGVGAGLKFTQRRWALENGYDTVCWTFDPMRAANANFNLRVLGVYADTYVPNVYGEIQDALNPGLPTDRLEVTWDLHAPRVMVLAEGKTLPAANLREHLALVTCEDGQLNAVSHVSKWTQGCAVEIPSEYESIARSQPELLRAWQAQVRFTMTEAFQQGYRVVDLVRQQNGRTWYVLELPD